MLVKRLGVFSCAKVTGILYAGIGFIAGLIFTFISLVIGSLAADYGGGPNPFAAIFGVGAIIFLPVFYGLAGFVGGALMAWMYNVIVGFAGGIEVEFEAAPSAPAQASDMRPV